MSEPNILHVYGQQYWHCDLQIIGTYGGLAALRDACNDALGDGYGETEAFQADGEGYCISVRRDPEGGWLTKRLPDAYIDEIAHDGDPAAWVRLGEAMAGKPVPDPEEAA